MNTYQNTPDQTGHRLLNELTISFSREILNGLHATAKSLPSKYFYDKEGDEIFQEIMNCEEYYPFNCELEIFRKQTKALADKILKQGADFELIELGAGDCTKSKYLLEYLVSTGTTFNYIPIDISGHIINNLERRLPLDIPGLKITGLKGEYFKMLEKAARGSKKRKVILFLGSNLGNMSTDEITVFTQELRGRMRKGDLALIGLDLKKTPSIVLAAYNDKQGITRKFNLNLLKRINKEMHANFDPSKFYHYPTYDPKTGDCKSYLVSIENQSVTLKDGNITETVEFLEGETIFMEVSHKFTRGEILELGTRAGFQTVGNYLDSKGWFLDTFWRAI